MMRTAIRMNYVPFLQHQHFLHLTGTKFQEVSQCPLLDRSSIPITKSGWATSASQLFWVSQAIGRIALIMYDKFTSQSDHDLRNMRTTFVSPTRYLTFQTYKCCSGESRPIGRSSCLGVGATRKAQAKSSLRPPFVQLRSISPFMKRVDEEEEDWVDWSIVARHRCELNCGDWSSRAFYRIKIILVLSSVLSWESARPLVKKTVHLGNCSDS